MLAPWLPGKDVEVLSFYNYACTMAAWKRRLLALEERVGNLIKEDRIWQIMNIDHLTLAINKKACIIYVWCRDITNNIKSAHSIAPPYLDHLFSETVLVWIRVWSLKRGTNV